MASVAIDANQDLPAADRSATIIDTLRFCAALCIIWYHNSYYFSLSQSDQMVVSGVKLIVLSWALPFFYVTTISFTFRKFWKKLDPAALKTRLAKLIKLVLAFVGVYEIPRVAWYLLDHFLIHRGFVYSPLGIQTSSLLKTLTSLLTTIVTVNESPVYFLNHVLVITLLTYIMVTFLKRWPTLVPYSVLFLGLILGFFIADYQNLTFLPSFVPFNRLVAICLFSTLIYEIAVVSSKPGAAHRDGALKVLVMSFLLSFCIGILSLLGWEAIYPVLAIGFLNLRDHYVLRSERWYATISKWGREYSLGIFLWHYFVLVIFANFAKFLPQEPSIFSYLLTTVGATIITWLVVFILKKWKITNFFVAF